MPTDLSDDLQSLSFGSQAVSSFSTPSGSSSSSSSREPSKPYAADPCFNAIRTLADPDGLMAMSDLRFIRRLGCGDIGSVYLAEVKCDGGDGGLVVAAKVMDKRELIARNKSGRARTEKEILGMLDHPFLPRLYGCAENERVTSLLTEFCPGGDLHVLRQRQPGKRFDEHAVRFYAAEVVAGLVFVAEPVDLRSMSFVGTHEYLAPEIISGEGHGSTVDWWTLGIFIFELLYGTTPFKGPDNEMTLANIVARALEFPREAAATATAQARDLVSGLLAKDPEKRLGSGLGATAVKRHPFFSGVNWALLRCAVPPHVPPPFTAGAGSGRDLSDDSSPGTPVEFY